MHRRMEPDAQKGWNELTKEVKTVPTLIASSDNTDGAAQPTDNSLEDWISNALSHIYMKRRAW